MQQFAALAVAGIFLGKAFFETMASIKPAQDFFGVGGGEGVILSSKANLD